MRAIGIAIATLILCLSVTANAKPKTYNWLYTIHLVAKINGQVMKKLEGSYIAKSSCEKMAALHRSVAKGTKDAESRMFCDRDQKIYINKKVCDDYKKAVKKAHKDFNWVCIRRQPTY